MIVSTVVFQELFEVKGKYEEEAMLREKAENFAAQVSKRKPNIRRGGILTVTIIIPFTISLRPGPNIMALLTVSQELVLMEAGNSTTYVKRISRVSRAYTASTEIWG